MREEEVEPGVAIVGGEVALTPVAAVSSDSSLPLRLAAVAAERDLPIARGALHRLADKMAPPPDPWPMETRQALVRVLATGRPAVDALESLDQQGLLVRILPEWAAVRNKPQRNAYHRFTVDRHLLEAAANAAALVDRVDRPDLLLVGTLLHDIGKGYPGDHTDGRDRADRHHRPPDGVPPGRRSDAGGARAAITSCCPTPPPVAISTTRPPSRPWLAPSATVGPSSCSAPSPRPTAWPPAPRPGGRGKRGSSPSWSSGPDNVSTATTPAGRGPPRPAVGSPTSTAA